MSALPEPAAAPGPKRAGPTSGRLIGFVRFLRANGFSVGIREGLDALRVAEICRPANQERMRWGLRALLCSNAEQWDAFGRLFDAYWNPPNRQARVAGSGPGGMEKREGQPGGPSAGETDGDVQGAGAGDDASAGGSRGGASPQESHAGTDFRFLQPGAEMREMEVLAERIARRMRRRLVRRLRVHSHGRRIHLRRALRSSLRYGGTPLDLVYKRQRRLLPRLILLVDVSRSMSLYSQMFLRFARGLVKAFEGTHAFVLHTRLVPVTDALRERDVGKLRNKLAALSLGWSGGTRLGDCLQTFDRGYGRLVHGRSVVLVLSDGLDTGPPARLAEPLGRIGARARSVVWLNPLLGREGYQPISRGMQAALPLIDLFAPAHNLASLQAIERYIARV
jgi:uncharacterized protein